MIGGMTKERWNELQRDINAELTPQEMDEGWHFCHEWDGLLIHPDMPEYEVCLCD